MEFIVPVLQVVGGLVALYFGGHFLVAGAAGIAKKMHISPIIIGLTVVAFGTSAPELFVSSVAAIEGRNDVALGNVIGSNIINLSLILGITSVFMVVPVSKSLIRRDIPIMFVGYAALILVLAGGPFPFIGDGVIYRWEGLILVALLVGYVVILYQRAKKSGDEGIEVIDMHEIDSVSEAEAWPLLAAKVLGGVVGLALGADFLVDGASWLAIEVFQVSERFVGITIVAFGTSLPELVTSITAMAKKQADISVGNVVGSNIFNSFMVIGLSSTIAPISGSLSNYGLDIAIMIGISVFTLVWAAAAKQFNRIAGLIFLAVYAAYFYFLVQGAAA